MNIPITIYWDKKQGFRFVLECLTHLGVYNYSDMVIWTPTLKELKELKYRIDEAIDECS